MTYAAGSRILASDFNTFTDQINAVSGVGTGSLGYGQYNRNLVNQGQKITAAAQWAQLQTDIINLGQHQGSTISTMGSLPTAGVKTAYVNTLQNNVNTVVAYRMYAAQQGGTGAYNNTNTGTYWRNYAYFYFTLYWPSADALRYFFNAGGQIGFSSTHPAGNIVDNIFNQLCWEAGTLWHSGVTDSLGTYAVLAGSVYTGVTKLGGGRPAGQVTNYNNGFYNMNGAWQILGNQYSGTGYYGDTYVSLGCQFSGSVLSYYYLLDQVVTVRPETLYVSPGTNVTMTIRYPSTAYLTNSWGTPTVNTAFSAAD